MTAKDEGMVTAYADRIIQLATDPCDSPAFQLKSIKNMAEALKRQVEEDKCPHCDR